MAATYSSRPLTSWLHAMLLLILTIDHSLREVAGQTCLVAIPPARSLTDGTARTCITDVDVNRAYARALTKVTVPSGNTEEPGIIGATGELFQATSEELLREMVGLSPVVAAQRFPRIGLRNTSIFSRCPTLYRSGGVTCNPAAKFRRIDGYCTEPTIPHHGATSRTFRRELPNKYADSLSKPRVSIFGESLPLARVISNTIHCAVNRNDVALNTMFNAFGQYLDHDITFGAVSAKNSARPDGKFECCTKTEHRSCMPLRIPTNDPFYSKFGQTCMNFQRVFPGLEQQCALGPRNQFNAATPVIDGSAVYGSNSIRANQVRDLSSKGRLATFSPWSSGVNLKPLLPQKKTNPSFDCVRPNATILCFVAGDDRNSEQAPLNMMHILFVRAHNSIAAELESLNPCWDSDRIYEETRRIIGAITQHIVINEYLPVLLPPRALDFYKLRPTPLYRNTGYDPKLDPQISQGFATAAFRFAHTQIPNLIWLASNTHNIIAMLQLRTMMERPEELYRPGRVDQFLLGALNQPADAFDPFMSDEVRNFLFQEPDKAFGMDLAARNIERGREHGVPGYTAFRNLCGLSPVNSWADLARVMPNETATAFSRIYRHVADVDLWSAGIAETKASGTILGPTFACMIGEQFSRLMYGDRFWYEFSGFPSSFTPAQLQEIKKITFSRLLCDHSDCITTIQKNAFLLQNTCSNPRVACGSGVIPRMSLAPWKQTANEATDEEVIAERPRESSGVDDDKNDPTPSSII